MSINEGLETPMQQSRESSDSHMNVYMKMPGGSDRYNRLSQRQTELLMSSRRNEQSLPFKILVGPIAKAYYVHADHLKKEIGYFKILFNSSAWAEVRGGELKWPDENVDVVSTMVDCLYGREVNVDRGVQTHDFVAECTQFAHTRDYPNMRNKLVRAYHAYVVKTKDWPSVQTITHIDDLGMKDLPLRRFVLDAVAWSVYLSARMYPDMKETRDNFLDSFVVEDDEEDDPSMSITTEVTRAQKHKAGRGKKETGDPKTWYLAKELFGAVFFNIMSREEPEDNPLRPDYYQEPQ